MNTEIKVTRFEAKKGIDAPFPTLVKAKEEAASYEWQRAGNGHYICKHGDIAHLIIEKGADIGCSCGDFSHRCKDGEACKHIAAFLMRKNPPAAKPDKRIAMDLIAAGWKASEHGNLYPPDYKQAAAEREAEVEAALDASWSKEHPETVRELPPALQDRPLGDLGVSEVPIVPKETKTATTEEKKMDKPVWDEEAWNGATQGNFASFGEDGIADVIFTANDFETGKPDKWGRTPYEFSVIQNNKSVILSVAAIRLMSVLKSMLPLEGKRVKIIRTGTGMDTQYEAQEVAE